ncbi:MAG: choice-of-anchor A family protein, partial [Verrucomicrobiota bacterium]|nr:choice-of-anchor A family protein [Verrucomicrobiota bacterium]
GGDTEGRLAVGGTARLNIAGYSVGYATVGRPIPILGATADMLIVGGPEFNDGNFEVNGNIVYAGTRTGPSRYFEPGANSMRRVVPITFDASGNVKDDGTGYTFDYLRERMEVRSGMYADKFERGVVGKERPDEWSGYTLVGNDSSLNVFNMDADEWSGVSREIQIIAPEGSTVLVNILGENVRFEHGRITLVGVGVENVIYNYVNATNVYVYRFDHEGSVLSPHANWQMSGAAVNGHAVIGGNVEKVVGSEFHNFYFGGSVCNGDRLINPDPAVSLALTMDSTPDGKILVVPEGTAVTNNYRVINTGVSYLGNIIIMDDVLGEVASVDTADAPLAPGASTNIPVVVTVTTDTVFRATVTVDPVDPQGVTNGLAPLQAADSASVVIGTPVDPNVPDPSWSRPDFAIWSIAFYGDEPTSPGDSYSVEVVVVNNGNLPGDAGTLSLYENAPNTAAIGTPGDVSQDVGVLQVAGRKTLLFEGLTAGDYSSLAYAVRAFVDSENITQEWDDDGDNQGVLNYFIEDLRADFAVLAMEFVGAAPTLINENFTLKITVANRGQMDGDLGSIGVYYSQREAFGTSMPTTPDAILWVGPLAKDEVKTITCTWLYTPSVRGLHHLRAVADYERTAREWSVGDNELSLVYVASMPTLQGAETEGVPGGVGEYTLAWQGFAGDEYSVEISTDLTAENAGFQTLATGIVLGGSSEYYQTVDGVIYFTDPTEYDSPVMYRVAFPMENAQPQTMKKVRSR